MLGVAIASIAALSSYLVQRRIPSHRPVTVALAWSAVAGVVCLADDVAPRAGMGACAVLPVVSAWMYLEVWRVRMDATGCGCGALLAVGWCLLAPWPGLWWEACLPALYAVGSLIGVLAWWQFRKTGSPSGITQDVAAVLLLGDIALVALAVAREVAPWQSRLVMLVVTVMHVVWLWRDHERRHSLNM